MCPEFKSLYRHHFLPMKKLDPKNLIAFEFFSKEPVSANLAYAHDDNFVKQAIYQKGVKCWAHRELMVVTLLAARLLHRDFGWVLEIKDCLRTSNAQTAMQNTKIVRANPHWLEPPRLVSPSGAGAHPRAMAVDVHPLDDRGQYVDMGTPFDWLEPSAARHFTDLSEVALQNREQLEQAFLKSAETFDIDFIAYSEEWWDFRFPREYYEQFAPLSDTDLPPQMQMTDAIDNGIENFPPEHFEKLVGEILSLVDNAYANL